MGETAIQEVRAAGLPPTRGLTTNGEGWLPLVARNEGGHRVLDGKIDRDTMSPEGPPSAVVCKTAAPCLRSLENER